MVWLLGLIGSFVEGQASGSARSGSVPSTSEDASSVGSEPWDFLDAEGYLYDTSDRYTDEIDAYYCRMWGHLEPEMSGIYDRYDVYADDQVFADEDPGWAEIDWPLAP